MDRHLIYPPDWDRRPKKLEWDADPSLKGKPIPIQGTNLILDKPEDLEAWIAERKRRWPTSERVEDKKRKMEEAIARGQLFEPFQRGNKRQKTDEGGDNRHVRGRGRGRGRDISSRGRPRATDSGWQNRSGASTLPIEATRTTRLVAAPTATDTSDSEGGDDDSPEAVSSKVPVTLLPVETLPKPVAKESLRMSHPAKRPPPQPKREPHNPFASRPTLLRNLLLPEIRITISNLSQAIRFLVDNDFLENVEVTPGAADGKPIQVIAEKDVSKPLE
ncbi:hypothetical protein H0H87_003822 [Tephrocybe sp. NHM501043]|nr:hypothetical protein H0H87_003822 [Tephrocybe sp. NHM501043]